MSSSVKKPRKTVRAAAADFIEPHRGAQAERIFDHLSTRARKGLTCAEIEAALGLKHQSASARVHELAKAGCIKLAGEQRGTPPSEVYAVVPGATFDHFHEWQKEDRDLVFWRRAAEQGLLKAAQRYVAAHGQPSFATAVCRHTRASVISLATSRAGFSLGSSCPAKPCTAGNDGTP